MKDGLKNSLVTIINHLVSCAGNQFVSNVGSLFEMSDLSLNHTWFSMKLREKLLSRLLIIKNGLECSVRPILCTLDAILASFVILISGCFVRIVLAKMLLAFAFFPKSFYICS